MIDHQWITKSDLRNFLACPFAFKKSREEGFEFFDLFMSPFALELMKRGREHEQSVKNMFSWKKVKFDIRDEKCIMRDVIVADLTVLNEKLGIMGTIDFLKTANGELIPIEIKNHIQENETDPYEIAFYWILLEPYRKKGKEPKGYYILRESLTEKRGVSEFLTPSSVDSTHIEDVLKFIEEMKNLKEYEPMRSSNCRDCALFEKVCFDVMKKKDCVSLLTTGEQVIQGMKDANLDIQKIAKMRPDELKSIRGIGDKKSRVFVNKAKAFVENKPIFFGTEGLPKSNNYIFVDTEFYQLNSPFFEQGCSKVFVISFGIYDGKNIDRHVLYENGWKFDCNIKKFVSALKKYPNAPVITWSGMDLHILKGEIETWVDKVGESIQSKTYDDLERRHFDLLKFVEGNIAFPLVSNSLKDVSEYLGFKRRETDMWGNDTFSIDNELMHSDKKIVDMEAYMKRKDVKNNSKKLKKAKEKIKEIENQKKPLQEKLFRYCEDDVLSLIFVFDWINKNLRNSNARGKMQSDFRKFISKS
jgi:predicted RecB family nuclease